jgi:hypothetical protein
MKGVSPKIYFHILGFQTGDCQEPMVLMLKLMKKKILLLILLMKTKSFIFIE